MAARLSRLSFIAGASALLAACSGHESMTLPSAERYTRASKSTRARKVATTSRQNFRSSTSSDGRAFALHNSDGSLIMSLVYGNAFMRVTNANGLRTVYSLTAPSSSGWTFLADGTRFAPTSSPAGLVGALIVPAATPDVENLVYVDANDDLVYLSNGYRVRQPVWGPAKKATTPQNWLQENIDDVGTWTGDDDFVGDSGDYPANAGFAAAQPSYPEEICAATGGIPDAEATGDDGDADDGALVVIANVHAHAHSSAPPTVTASSPPSIGGFFGGGQPPCQVIHTPPVKIKGECIEALIEAAGAAIALVGAGLLVVAACGIPEPVEPIACAGAIIAYEGAFAVAAATAVHAAKECQANH